MNVFRFHPRVLSLLLVTILFAFGLRSLAVQQSGSNNDSADSDRQAKLVVQLGHSGDVSTAAFSSDGRRIVTGGRDGAILWDVATGSEIQRFAAHSVSSVAFSPDGKYVLTGGWDKTARLWELETNKEVRKFEKHSAEIYAVAYSPDGRRVLTGSFDKTARLWDADTGVEICIFTGHSQSIDRVAYSPNGKYVLTGSLDETARLWDVTTGKQVRSFDSPVMTSHPVAFSPDGNFVFTGGWDKTVRMWETETGSRIKEFKLSDSDKVQNPVSAGVQPAVSSLAVSQDGKFLLAGFLNSQVKLWAIESGQEVQSFPVGSASVDAVAFSPDGKYVLFSGVSAQLFEAQTGKLVEKLEEQFTRVNSIAVSADSKYLVTAGGSPLRIWDLERGAEVRKLAEHSGSLYAVSFSPDGSLVAGGGFDKLIHLWSVETGQEVLKLEWPESPAFGITHLAFSRDGKYLLIGDMKTAMLWDAHAGTVVRKLEGLNYVDELKFSPNGKLVIGACLRSDCGPGFQFGFPAALLWDTETGRVVNRTEGPEAWISRVTTSADGKFALLLDPYTYQLNALGAGIREAKLMESSGKEVRQFSKSYLIFAASFTSNGKFVVTAGGDGTSRIWETSSGRELCRLVSFRDGTWAVIDPAGRFDTNNLEEIKGLHWIMPDDPMRPLPLEIFMRDYYEPRLLSRILTGEQFKPIRALADLNRVQPGVKITSIERQHDHPDLVTVTVEVSTAKSERQTDPRGNPRETGVYDLRLFRDGQIVGQYADDRPQSLLTSANENQKLLAWREENQVKLVRGTNRSIKFENIKLPRSADIKQVEFSAYAFNEDRVKSQTNRKSFQIPTDLAPHKGSAYIIAVGVNAYESQNWNLKYAANDAREMRAALSTRLTASKQFAEVIDIALISNDEQVEDKVVQKRDATKANIRTVLELLAGKEPERTRLDALRKAVGTETFRKLRQARPEDAVFLSFSSHGYADRNGIFYILPTDIGANLQRKVTSGLLQNSISSDELSLWLSGIDAGEMVIIVDACNADAAVKNSEFKPAPMGSRGLGQLAYDKGILILTATQADNVAIESGGTIGHGLLTYALLNEGLESASADFRPRDTKIQLTEWLQYGETRVPKLYEELATGKLKLTGRDAFGITVAGQKEEKLTPQQPTLFDFRKRHEDLTLVH
jgi:WD40 repeat protein